MDEEILITFDSVHQAMDMEDSLEGRIKSKTIPTPREITVSCGLSILFDGADLDRVSRLIEEENLKYKNIYKFNSMDNKRQIELIK